MNYWERWIGDWKRKTAHLSAEAKGVYGEMLDHEYATHKALPLDLESTYRIAAASTQSERKAVDRVLAEFYIKTESGYVNGRAQQEIAKRTAYVEAQRGRANARWHQETEEVKQPKLRGNGSHKVLDDTSPIVERIPLLGGEEFEVRESFAAELTRLYPNVDIPATLRQMRGWCIGNPTKLKTPRGIKKFITGWCERDQNGS